MLDAFIIEEIKRRERMRQQEGERPVAELPVPKEDERRPRREEDEKPQRGVVVIELAIC